MTKRHVFSMIGACIAIAFAVGACDSETRWDAGGTWNVAESCSDFTTCDTCTAANGCGWCFQSEGGGVCGDDANSCATEFAWETNFCRAPADASVSSSATDAASSSKTEDAAGNTDAAESLDADTDGD